MKALRQASLFALLGIVSAFAFYFFKEQAPVFVELPPQTAQIASSGLGSLPQSGASTRWFTGNSSKETITGTAANDQFSGNGGSDTFIGFAGDDIYVYYSSSDKAVENPDEGTDTIYSWGKGNTITLPANVENIVFKGASNGGAVGNDLANRFEGTAENNVFEGKGGADEFICSGGADTVKDFEIGTDKIICSDSAATLSQSGTSDALLTLSTGTMKLSGIWRSGLTIAMLTGEAQTEPSGQGSSSYTISVSKAGSGSGTVSGGGISCGSTCSRSEAAGTPLGLTATPASGSTFAGWSGACSGKGSCLIQLSSDVSVTATFDAAGSSSPTPPVPPAQSSENMLLAMFLDGNTPKTSIPAFERSFGRSVDLVTVFLDERANCNGAWSLANSANWISGQGTASQRFTVGFPMLMRSATATTSCPNPVEPNTTLAAAARGDYDAYYKAAAQAFLNKGHEDSIIRPGWEFQGNWFTWGYKYPGQDQANYAENYKKAFQNIVKEFRAVSPKFKFAWNPNLDTGGFDPALAYPGDDYVDYVALDVYDFYYSKIADPAQRFDNDILNAKYGLKWLANFAKAHGKPMAFPEWGCGQAAGDNPHCIEAMHKFMTDNPQGVATAFQGYWNSNSGYKAKFSSYPLQDAKFRQLFGGTPSAPAAPDPTPAPTPVRGACGSFENICVSGTLDNVDDSATNLVWHCLGQNGGVSVSCSLPKPATTPAAPTAAPSTPAESPNTGGSSSDGGSSSGGGGGGGGGSGRGSASSAVLCGTKLNICARGTLLDVGDTVTHDVWQCKGSGGESVQCAMRKSMIGVDGSGSGSVVSTPSAPAASSQAAQSGPSTSASGPSGVQKFARSLSTGFTGEDVRELQRFLNGKGYSVAATGPGSAGNETTLFGAGTRAALAKFQAASGLPATGYFGPLTISTVHKMLGISVSSPVPADPASVSPAPASSSGPLSRTLYFGITGEDVRSLQKLLNAKGYMIASSGPGSAGNETALFGRATETAVKRFQCEKMRICSGTVYTTGYGLVGARTRAALLAD